MELKTLGAAGGEVTGSCNVLSRKKDDGTEESVMVDCGIFQGTNSTFQKNYEKLAFDVSKLAGVVASHAHGDHVDGLPRLAAMGFEGKYYMTAPTAAALPIHLNDLIKVVQNNQLKPLYNKEHVKTVLDNIVEVPYDSPFNFGSYTGILSEAGHTPGSAIVQIIENGGPNDGFTTVFSGDLGNSPSRILNNAAIIKQADAVVMETTYGDKTHSEQNVVKAIYDVIKSQEKRGEGTAIFGAFAYDRSQRVTEIIADFKNSEVIGDIPVYYYAPMGYEFTKSVYSKFLGTPFFNDEINDRYKKDGNPFLFEGLRVISCPRVARRVIESDEAQIIIASSGMWDAGPIVSIAKEHLKSKSCTAVKLGYHAPGTNGSKIFGGDKFVWMGGEKVPVNASKVEINMSAHRDQNGLLDFLRPIKGVKKVILTHGGTPQREAFRDLIGRELGIRNVVLPERNEVIPL